MQFVISVDCEGCACVVGAPGGTLDQSANRAFACRQATRETAACADALFQAGATNVIVVDSHSSGVNLDYDQLDPRCQFVIGSNYRGRLPGLTRDFAGVCFIGYHAMDSTVDAVLAHTFSSVAYQSITINGRRVGEMAIDAAIAGAAGVPVIFVSSDDKGVAEAREFFPWAETVVTKNGLGWNATLSKHPQRACDEIRVGTGRAVQRRSEMKPFLLPGPFEVGLRFKRIDACEQRERRERGWERVDAYTLRTRCQRLEELF